MQRLLTALIAAPLAVAAMFLLPPPYFFALCALLIDWGAVEFVRLARAFAPKGPIGVLPVLVPLSALVCAAALHGVTVRPGAWLFGAGLVISVGFGALVLWCRTPLAETMASWGVLAFGLPYFSLPIASLYWIQRSSPWLIFLLCAIVWLGDSAALYAGKAFGRHRLAPVVSPHKSWEGAAAGFLTGLAATAVWSFFRQPDQILPLLAVAAATSIAAQTGDLVESLIKRSAGVKDSGGVLPGHGGFFDRMDAMLFGAPVFLVGLWLIGFPGL
jgi:phosphatidate cytidylyltransferase